MSDRDLLYRFAVVTLFPEMFAAIEQLGITGRAFQNGVCQLTLHDPREEATDRHGTVDDRPYGGGPGMVMTAPILSAALVKAKVAVDADAPVIALTPQGQKLDARLCRQRRRMARHATHGCGDAMATGGFGSSGISCRGLVHRGFAGLPPLHAPRDPSRSISARGITQWRSWCDSRVAPCSSVAANTGSTARSLVMGVRHPRR